MGAVGASALFTMLFGGGFMFFIVMMVFLSARRGGGRGLMPSEAVHPSQGAYLSGTDVARQHAGSLAELQVGLDEIRAHDPDFDPSAFVTEVNKAFFVIQQAWVERTPELARRVMADGIWQQHRFQIQQYVTAGKQNVLENLAIQSTVIVWADSDATYDTILVRFFASCADYDIDLNDKNKVVRGSKRVEPWTEDWAFQRSSSAVTRPDGGTLADRCPNCGAPLDVDIAGVCSYCKVMVMSGEYDWVLARIEQLPSWEYGQQTLPR